jgi:hypothetical protein
VNVLPGIWGALTLGAALWLSRPRCPFRGLRWSVIAFAAGGLLAGVLTGRLDAAAFYAVALAVLAWDWWHRKGKRVAKAIGAKSRAVLAAVVARAREAGTPLPEGARA